MQILQIPNEGVISIDACGTQTVAQQRTGYFDLYLDQVVYSRAYSEDSGLIHLKTNIDVMLNKEWYDKYITFLEKNHYIHRYTVKWDLGLR